MNYLDCIICWDRLGTRCWQRPLLCFRRETLWRLGNASYSVLLSSRCYRRHTARRQPCPVTVRIRTEWRPRLTCNERWRSLISLIALFQPFDAGNLPLWSPPIIAHPWPRQTPCVSFCVTGLRLANWRNAFAEWLFVNLLYGAFSCSHDCFIWIALAAFMG